MECEWISFDIPRLELLREEYEEALAYAMNEMPPVNWNSPKQIKELFKDRYNITLESVKIAELKSHFRGSDHNDEVDQAITGAITILSQKAVLRNYFDCILKHQVGGRLNLRDVDGIWRMPNKQPIWTNKDIWSCVTGISPSLAAILGHEEASW